MYTKKINYFVVVDLMLPIVLFMLCYFCNEENGFIENNLLFTFIFFRRNSKFIFKRS